MDLSINFALGMEAWELEFEYLRIRHFIKDKFGKTELPDLNTILLLIGIQELGKVSTTKFTKEEKTDLLHIATCRLLSQDGYYEFEDWIKMAGRITS
ncbi:MAG: hypothetical protein IPN97_07710 [Saprospiraceae bacterium]|nr:hypothetical protein [Saprospiraceae bacterium]